MRVAIPPLTQYALMAWCSVRNRRSINNILVMTGVRVTGKRNTKIKYDYSEKAQYVTNIKKCEVYRNSNNLTKKQQHRPMG
jgi:hypothetical protein